MECYHDDTIEEMREEKVLMDHPELADKILKTNVQVGTIMYCNIQKG